MPISAFLVKRLKKQLRQTLFLFCCLFFSPFSQAEQATLKLGIGLFMLSAPDYLGSAHSQTLLLPFPMIKYRGEKLKIDNGVTYQILDDSRFLLSLSGNGSLPSSDTNIEREGMRQLDATVEIGPSIDYLINETSTTKLWLHLPLRFTFSVGGNTGYIGNVLNPKISWRQPATNVNPWRLGFTNGLLFSNQQLNRYYYTVQANEATALRPAYEAKSGYTGFRSEFTFSRKIDPFWLGGFVRFDDISGSINLDSPLISKTNSWSIGVALSWVFSER